MGKKKINYGLSMYLFVIIFFIIHGLVFFGVGMAIVLSTSANQDRFSPLLYALPAIGVIGWIISAIALYLCVKRKKKIDDLLENGKVICARIERIEHKNNIQFNGSGAYRIRCGHTDPSNGAVYQFESRLFYQFPNGVKIGHEVPVYVDRQDFNVYFVDIDAAF